MPVNARYLNMHARNGVAANKMDIAVVVHGPALKTMLTVLQSDGYALLN